MSEKYVHKMDESIMVDYTTPLQQLPDFLRREIVGAVGSTNNLSQAQIISRYRAEADRLAAVKRSQYRHYSDNSGIFGSGPLVKAEMDFLKAMVDGQPRNHSSLFANLRSRYVAESIPYLTHFSTVLAGLQAQAEQNARQQSEEATRQNAQRQAEEVARRQAQRQAEEAARQLAQRQAEEAARQLAQRQAEEANRIRTQREVERGAFLQIVPSVRRVAVEQLLHQARVERAAIEKNGIIYGEKGNQIIWLPGPVADFELEHANRQLAEDVEKAIAEFVSSMDFDAGVTASEALNAMLYALQLGGTDIPAFTR